MNRRLLLPIIILLITIFGIFQYFKYWKALEEEEQEAINSIYKKSFEGVISYLQEYKESENNFVFTVKTKETDEITIGKIKVQNFLEATVGDSIIKKANTFEVKVKSNGSWQTSILVYD